MKRILLFLIFMLCLIQVREICAKNPQGFSTPAPPVNPAMPSVPEIPDRSNMPKMPTMKPFPTIKPFPTMKSVPTAKPTKKSGSSSELEPYGEDKKPGGSSGLEPYGQEPEPVTPSGGKSNKKPDDLVPFGETPSVDIPPETEAPSVVEPYEPEKPATGKVKPAPTQKEEVVPFEPNNSPGAVTGATGEVAPYEPGSSDANAVPSDPNVSDANAVPSDPNSAGVSPSPEENAAAGPSEQKKGLKGLKEIPVAFYIGAAVMIVFPVLIYFLSRKKKL
ncbi:MAG: hypothetical protein ABRQ37_06225 [Candidatus Eremiobacterota bacterium]